MVSYYLYENVTENLSSYTRTQVLTLAAFGLDLDFINASCDENDAQQMDYIL